jgi:hypothetical protein
MRKPMCVKTSTIMIYFTVTHKVPPTLARPCLCFCTSAQKTFFLLFENDRISALKFLLFSIGLSFFF